MIIIAIQDKSLAKRLKDDLYEASLDARIVNCSDKSFITEFYKDDVSAIIAEDHFKHLPFEAVADVLNSMASRIPVLILRSGRINKDLESYSTHEFSDASTVLDINNYNEILTTASLFYGLTSHTGIKSKCKSIPYYNSQIPISMLSLFGGLGVLTIDASGFNKISVEYGSDVYTKVKDVFHDILFNLWGKPGSFRDDDVICRKSVASNSYMIFMTRSRETGALPYPGALERIADRISHTIHNALWEELFKPRAERRIPLCLETIPSFGVGFFGLLNNPCIDIQEILDSGLEASKVMAQSQIKRGRERKREMMQTLIQSELLLQPFYQAVFDLQAMSKEVVDEVKSSKSISPIRDHIYGFESLIRVNKDELHELDSFENGIETRFLRPDVLFALAKNTKVALELDQACMRHAARCSSDLPGILMINILPRNLYYIERLRDTFERQNDLMFEISESEAINNFDLMIQSRDYLEANNIGIAADDFGKGYSSLERIIRIKPQVIKFDRGIIQDVDKDQVKQAYVQGLVQAAKILNTTILAEGVETWEEAETLKNMGVHLIQGFLLHRPEKEEQIQEQLQSSKRRKTVA